ncbi:MAG: hypothetical protein R3350_07465, partial [Saprospiraceae bacterium]|nr:hypothetical protein [Saprospiraceae bacterium]
LVARTCRPWAVPPGSQAPAPHGRAHPIRKRSNHVTIVVENRIPLPSDVIEANEDVEIEEFEETEE